jgi:hypothetical protein
MRLVTLLLPLSLMTVIGLAHSQTENWNASRTFEFDPDKTSCAVANWDSRIGLEDSPQKTTFGLKLEKNCHTTVNASAGVVLNNLKGIIVQSMGYDIKDGSLCGAGSPRFNVQQADGTFHFVGGCATKVPLVGTGWSRVTIDPSNPALAFPVFTPGSPVVSIVLIVDEEGKHVLDNIQLNGVYAQKPGAAK